MKLLKTFVLLPFAFILFISTGTQLSSCQKTRTVIDTTYITVHDTTTVVDSIYDLTSGLVAYYNFNGGNTNDSSGFNNKIILNNNATAATDRFGNANNAFSFDGSSSYMKVANSPSINPNSITLFAIVKVNGFYAGACNGNQILGKGYPDGINGWFVMRFIDTTNTHCSGPPNTNTELFGAAFGDSGPASTAYGENNPIQTGDWYNLVYTYDGHYAKFYLNGQLTETTLASVSFTPNTNDLFIGRNEDPAYPYYFNGVIDEIRIYNRALSAGEINQLNKLKE
jgi:hypothetical protein